MNTAGQNVANERKLFNPHAYFRAINNLFIYGIFADYVLPNVGPIPYRGCEDMTSVVLTRNMSDQEIIDEILGGMDQARASAVTLDQIAVKIHLQPHGKDGDLSNGSCNNIFFVLVGEVLLSVRLGWSSEYRRWSVGAFPLGGGGQLACWLSGLSQ